MERHDLPADSSALYQAYAARDRRFDGLFLVGVASTGIYCRPVCPARTARRENCSFFKSPPEAEAAGYRACLRCRPERASGTSRDRVLDQVTDYMSEPAGVNHGAVSG